MICGLVLAAGRSRRMGANKLLLPYGEETAISHIVRTVVDSSVQAVYVVTGHESERISRELSRFPVSIVLNPAFEEGMLSSVRSGLSALPAECTEVILVLGDQPGISTGLIDALIQKVAATDKTILVPTYQGSRGHPLLFSMQYNQEIQTQFDDTGLHGLLRAHPEEVEEVEMSAPAVLRDMDRPEDYLKELGLR